MKSQAPQSICVLRLSAIGDVCHTVPAVRAIQTRYPEAHITWIIGATEAALVGDLPGIEFITVQKQHGFSGWRRLRRQLAGKRFDVLLHMQYALRASGYSTAISARRRLGYDRQRARDLQWLFTNCAIPARPGQHVMDGLLEFARELGADCDTPVWDIPIPQDAAQFVNQIVHGKGQASAPIALISPAASHSSRNWIPQRYAEVADALVSQHGLKVVLSGSPAQSEIELCLAIEEQAVHPLVNLAGKTSLKQLFAMISASELVIAPDSGPAHMATAAGVPVIGLYAASNPERTGPYLNRDLTVNHYPLALKKLYGKQVEQVRFGFRVKKGHPMAEIQVSDVLAKVPAALARNQAIAGT